jgi:hypothetical protein
MPNAQSGIRLHTPVLKSLVDDGIVVCSHRECTVPASSRRGTSQPDVPTARDILRDVERRREILEEHFLRRDIAHDEALRKNNPTHWHQLEAAWRARNREKAALNCRLRGRIATDRTGAVAGAAREETATFRGPHQGRICETNHTIMTFGATLALACTFHHPAIGGTRCRM